MNLSNADNLPGYIEVRNGSAYYIYTESGFLQIEGPDRFDFLQRQTTNDINLLTPGNYLTTVLVNSTARILDVFQLFGDEHEEKLNLITLPGYAGNTTRFLQSRIFFMDDVTVTDSTNVMSQILLGGRQVNDLLSTLVIDPLPGLGQLMLGSIAGKQVLIIGEKVLQKDGYRLIFPRELRESVEARLIDSGALSLSGESYHVLRIEAGIPAAGAELVDEYTPLEAGLDAAISSSKGCFTGQEVIARQLTYDKVTRHLVGLRLENFVNTGVRISVEGKPSGTTTSSTISPTYGPIALAYIKRPYHQPGVNVTVDHSNETVGIPATVDSLPFI